MFLIVGLGNPGGNYEDTRHNAGFMLIDRLCARHGVRMKKTGSAAVGKGVISGVEVALIKPQKFMNLSGEVILAVMRETGAAPEELIVMHDDSDLALGRLRLKKDGGSGGHRGVDSTIRCVGSRNFIRVRLGIGRPDHGELSDYVLGRFAPDERDVFEVMLDSAADSVEAVLTDGIDKAMNRFNPKG